MFDVRLNSFLYIGIIEMWNSEGNNEKKKKKIW